MYIDSGHNTIMIKVVLSVCLFVYCYCYCLFVCLFVCLYVCLLFVCLFVCLFADDRVGAACCTGDGDEILKFCPSFKVVQFIEQVII